MGSGPVLAGPYVNQADGEPTAPITPIAIPVGAMCRMAAINPMTDATSRNSRADCSDGASTLAASSSAAPIREAPMMRPPLVRALRLRAAPFHSPRESSHAGDERAATWRMD